MPVTVEVRDAEHSVGFVGDLRGGQYWKALFGFLCQNTGSGKAFHLARFAPCVGDVQLQSFSLQGSTDRDQ